MQQVSTGFARTANENPYLCPRCETPGGYILRVPRAKWRRLLFLKKKHYLCQECGHRFYTDAQIKC